MANNSDLVQVVKYAGDAYVCEQVVFARKPAVKTFSHDFEAPLTAPRGPTVLPGTPPHGLRRRGYACG